MMDRTRRFAALATATVLPATVLAILWAVPAGASCARPPTVEEGMARADLVFVGRAVEVTNSGRWAFFAVEDVWKGALRGRRAEVRGGAQEGLGTSVDRTYVLDTRYLVFADSPPSDPGLRDLYGAGVRWTDDACSMSQPHTPGLVGSRPDTARLVEGTSPQERSAEPSPERADAPTGPLGGDPGSNRGSTWVWIPFVGVAVLGLLGMAAARAARRE